MKFQLNDRVVISKLGRNSFGESYPHNPFDISGIIVDTSYGPDRSEDSYRFEVLWDNRRKNCYSHKLLILVEKENIIIEIW